VQAIPVPGTRGITADKLNELKAAVSAMAARLADGLGRWRDENAVATELRQAHLTGGDIFQFYADPLVPSTA
jgi:hypothetical protein